MMTIIAIDDLVSLLSYAKGAQYVEARYQSRITNEVNFGNGQLERIRTATNSGCGLRVLVDGCWGFSSTSSIDKNSLKEALEASISSAKILSLTKKNRVAGLSELNPVKGIFKAQARGPLEDVSIEEKVKITKATEARARSYSDVIKSASCIYREIIDHKFIVNSDGTQVEIYDSKPEFNVISVARRGDHSITTSEGIGITGGWEDLYSKRDLESYGEIASEKATKLLDARHVNGEKTTIILDPGMVGLISHEAMGHMVEADFVLSGSIVRDKVGHKLASELVTLVDSGRSNIAGNAAGTIAVDEEGVRAEDAVIIKKGILNSFLHNRETAFSFGVKSTGNARAFEYNDEPLVRMRNTYINPGTDRFEEIIKETKHGYLLKGARNGQADANGEFMFGSQEAYLVENGEIKELLRGASVSGNAFDVLQSVDMVGNSFEYDIGTGYCGKMQPAKVDGGGPYIRCTAIIGGLQEQ